jgi:adenylosuccinate lyase
MQDTLFSLSPLDGRYFKHTEALRPYFSEFALIKYRLIAESAWLKHMVKLFHNTKVDYPQLETLLNDLEKNFSGQEAEMVKQIERTTNHDVKSIEYFLRKHLKDHGIDRSVLALIHYAITSEDINNIAYALILKQVKQNILQPLHQSLITHLTQQATQFASTPMLSRTHGQCASPTTIGKEFANVAYRLACQVKCFDSLPIFAKINGAVGNFNAHSFCSPQIDWLTLSQDFIESLGLHNNPYTTQIEPHDNLAQHGDTLARINTILTDFCRDLWAYIAIDYLCLQHQEHEVGSSTMPHKINPIDFENAEGNFGLSTALFRHFSEKLPISRWQRDLSDSTVMRNVGVALGHHLVGLHSLEKGMLKIEPNTAVLMHDISSHPEVITEAIQTMMRHHGIADAYEQLKAFARGHELDLQTIHQFVHTLDLPEESKNKILSLQPQAYLGLAEHLALNLEEYIAKI